VIKFHCKKILRTQFPTAYRLDNLVSFSDDSELVSDLVAVNLMIAFTDSRVADVNNMDPNPLDFDGK
jgi:hypothetical protein